MNDPSSSPKPFTFHERPKFVEGSAPCVVEMRDLGVWYRLRGRRELSLKQALLAGRASTQSRTLWALRHVDFQLPEGAVLGIVGRNGAGKSTLCLVLARILTPDEGEAHIHGSTTPLLTLGSGFHQELSGLDNIYIYSAYLGTPRQVVEQKLEQIVAFSELEAFIDEPLYTYSSGMRARLGFAIASALDPEIMILDEVLGVGDREFRAKSRARILEMMRQSRVIVIVSHSLQFLRRICTHGLWLDKGQQVAFGKAEEVFDRYMAATGGASPDAEE